MTRSTPAFALAVAALTAAMFLRASAHVVAGDRVFPVTLTFDDPGVGDEATLPQITSQRSAGPGSATQFLWEYDKRITSTTALIYNQGYAINTGAGDKRRTGFQNVFVSGKWQAFTFPDHEFVASFGIIREFGGGHATQGIGGDEYGSTAPTLYVGKGLGDLPIGMARPLAITGELSYGIPDHPLNNAGDNNGSPRTVNGAFSVQYSLPYSNAQVRALPGVLSHLVPLVEVDGSTPAGGPAHGIGPTLTVAPGVIYEGPSWQAGIEALIPANRAAGQNVGVTAQFHVFFDDIFPTSLGKPLFDF